METIRKDPAVSVGVRPGPEKFQCEVTSLHVDMCASQAAHGLPLPLPASQPEPARPEAWLDCRTGWPMGRRTQTDRKAPETMGIVLLNALQ